MIFYKINTKNNKLREVYNLLPFKVTNKLKYLIIRKYIKYYDNKNIIRA